MGGQEGVPAIPLYDDTGSNWKFISSATQLGGFVIPLIGFRSFGAFFQRVKLG